MKICSPTGESASSEAAGMTRLTYLAYLIEAETLNYFHFKPIRVGMNLYQYKSTSLVLFGASLLLLTLAAFADKGTNDPKTQVLLKLEQVQSHLRQISGTGGRLLSCNQPPPGIRAICPSLVLAQINEESAAGKDKVNQCLKTDTKTPGEWSQILHSHLGAYQGSTPLELSSSCVTDSTYFGPGSKTNGQQFYSLTDQQKSMALARTMINQERLDLEKLASLESIASLDSVLGKKNLEGINCQQADSSVREQKRCDKLKSCPDSKASAEGAGTKAFLRMLTDTSESLQLIIPLKKNWEQTEESRKELCEGTFRDENHPLCEQATKNEFKARFAYEQTSATLGALHPWLGGKHIKRLLESKSPPDNLKLSSALKVQLAETRNSLVSRRDQLSNAQSCLFADFRYTTSSESKINETTNAKIKCPDFQSTIDSTAPLADLRVDREQENKSNKLDRLYFNSMLGYEECASANRDYQQLKKSLTTDMAADIAIGGALSIATCGLASFAGASIAARGLARIGRATTMSQKAARTAAIAKTLTYGTDAAWAVAGLNEAAKACEKDLNKLATQYDQSNPDPDLCPQVNNYRGPQLVEDTQACIKRIALSVVTGSLPFTPRYIRESREGKRIARAEQLIERPLNKSEKEALLASHYVGSRETGQNGLKSASGNYSKRQIAEKAHILEKAGFSAKERRKLMLYGVTGDGKTETTELLRKIQLEKTTNELSHRPSQAIAEELNTAEAVLNVVGKESQFKFRNRYAPPEGHRYHRTTRIAEDGTHIKVEYETDIETRCCIIEVTRGSDTKEKAEQLKRFVNKTGEYDFINPSTNPRMVLMVAPQYNAAETKKALEMGVSGVFRSPEELAIFLRKIKGNSTIIKRYGGI